MYCLDFQSSGKKRRQFTWVGLFIWERRPFDAGGFFWTDDWRNEKIKHMKFLSFGL
jgi:hypothetical protein